MKRSWIVLSVLSVVALSVVMWAAPLVVLGQRTPTPAPLPQSISAQAFAAPALQAPVGDPFFGGSQELTSRRRSHNEFLQLAQEFAEALTDEELQEETEKLRGRVSDAVAKRTLGTIRTQLHELIDKHPGTEASRAAEQMLNMQPAPIPDIGPPVEPEFKDAPSPGGF